MFDPKQINNISPEVLYGIKAPKTDDELWKFVKDILGVAIPRVVVVEGHCSPFQAFADAYFCRHPFTVWVGSRGSGKSFLLALLSLTEMITLGASICVLGGSKEQSERVHQYLTGKDPNSAGQFWEAPKAPTWLREGDATKSETNLINDGKLKCLTASEKNIRGQRANRLRLDECDVMDRDNYNASLSIPFSSRGIRSQVVASSTYHIPNGIMNGLLHPKIGEEKHPIYMWNYKECLKPHGWIDPEEIETKKKILPAHVFAVEFDLCEPMQKGRAINRNAVEIAFDRELGVFDGTESITPTIIEDYQLSTHYGAGADFAKSVDWSVYCVFKEASKDKIQPAICVGWQRMGRLPWDVMAQKFDHLVERYRASAWIDATGPGQVVKDILKVRATPFDFQRTKDKLRMIADYVNAIETGKVKYPMIDWAYKEHLYATWDDLYGSGHLPDSIVAGALAWQALQLSGAPLIGRLGGPR